MEDEGELSLSPQVGGAFLNVEGADNSIIAPLVVEKEQSEDEKRMLKIRRILTTVATLFIVLTYIEDGYRILSNWQFQKNFIKRSNSVPLLLIDFFLAFSALAQLCAVLLAIPVHVSSIDMSIIGVKKVIGIPPIASVVVLSECILLTVSVILQPIIYAQWENLDFLCMSVAQLGALMLLALEALQCRGAKIIWPFSKLGLMVDEIKLGARVLLTTDFFVVYAFHLMFGSETKRWDDRAFQGFLHVIAAGLLWSGFQTMTTSCVVALFTLVDSFYRFPYWTKEGHSRDYYQFLFYHSISMVGGMLLLAATGPGKISVDNNRQAKKFN